MISDWSSHNTPISKEAYLLSSEKPAIFWLFLMFFGIIFRNITILVINPLLGTVIATKLVRN